ncbi:hypothetical protein ACFHW2_11535 [Actinomadura sp. LOL_016]|uniref:hypothetical protein n=1 Tax=unclassified Actinomadura TaxID=2626254 RepID=UPI003A7FDF72
MADRITAEQLDLLAETDPLRLRDEAIGLLTEIDRLRSELAEVRTGKVEQMLGRLGDWGEIGEYVRNVETQREEAVARLLADLSQARTRHLMVKADRDLLEGAVRRLAEQASVLTKAVRGADPFCPDHGDHENPGCDGCAHALAVRAARRLLDVEKAGQKSGADLLLDHIETCHPDVAGLVAAQSGALTNEVAEMERQGWTVESTEYVAGKRVRIMRPPSSAPTDGEEADRG